MVERAAGGEGERRRRLRVGCVLVGAGAVIVDVDADVDVQGMIDEGSEAEGKKQASKQEGKFKSQANRVVRRRLAFRRRSSVCPPRLWPRLTTFFAPSILNQSTNRLISNALHATMPRRRIPRPSASSSSSTATSSVPPPTSLLYRQDIVERHVDGKIETGIVLRTWHEEADHIAETGASLPHQHHHHHGDLDRPLRKGEVGVVWRTTGEGDRAIVASSEVKLVDR